jgi:hypothetical protein
MHLKIENWAPTNQWEILKVSGEYNSLCSFEIYTEYLHIRTVFPGPKDAP